MEGDTDQKGLADALLYAILVMPRLIRFREDTLEFSSAGVRCTSTITLDLSVLHDVRIPRLDDRHVLVPVGMAQGRRWNKVSAKFPGVDVTFLPAKDVHRLLQAALADVPQGKAKEFLTFGEGDQNLPVVVIAALGPVEPPLLVLEMQTDEARPLLHAARLRWLDVVRWQADRTKVTLPIGSAIAADVHMHVHVKPGSRTVIAQALLRTEEPSRVPDLVLTLFPATRNLWRSLVVSLTTTFILGVVLASVAWVPSGLAPLVPITVVPDTNSVVSIIALLPTLLSSLLLLEEDNTQIDTFALRPTRVRLGVLVFASSTTALTVALRPDGIAPLVLIALACSASALALIGALGAYVSSVRPPDSRQTADGVGQAKRWR